MLPNLNRTCWICGNAVPPESGQNDELGNPVHEPCLSVRAELARAAISSAKKPPTRSTGSRIRKKSIGASGSPRA
jgi:hypothetical protein